MKAVFDTSILIDYLLAYPEAENELLLYKNPIISYVTWIEVLVGTKHKTEEIAARTFLNNFKILSISPVIAEIAIDIRRDSRIKLPDAIIWATALSEETILVTRNTKDFPEHHPGIRIPYQLNH